MRKTFYLTLIFSLGLLAACQPSRITSGALEVRDAWARPSVTDSNGAVYLTIENGTDQNDVLLSAQTDLATAVELHLSQMDGDHMSMHRQEQVAIPSGEAVRFSPGGFHVMLIGLTRDLKTGETFELQLDFERAGQKTVTVIVKDDVNDD
jgi:copper(I)-binding protein